MRPGARYVALGSSFAAGPGILPVVDAAAMRSGSNYAHQVAVRLDLDLRDATSSGATTANVLSEPQVTEHGTLPPQIDAVDDSARLVTVTIGGNDVDYLAGIIQGWYAAQARRDGRYGQWLADQELPLAQDPRNSLARVALAEQRIGHVLREVRLRASRATVLAVDYLTVLGPDLPQYPQMPLAPEEVAALQALGAALAGATAAAARSSGALLVPAGAASERHGVGSSEPWISGPASGDPLRGEPIPFHPTLAGMTAVAHLVAASLGSP
jgi:lysophospholipase L1-like esterase